MTVSLLAVANDYAKHGLGAIPVLPRRKESAIPWLSFQYEPPTALEREAMFSAECDLNIGIICGAASGNLAMIDAETDKAFEEQLRHCQRVGIDNTWIDKTPRGGHIWMRFPVPVKPTKGVDVEIRAQGQYGLAPPSITSAPYKFLHRPPDIFQVPSLEIVDWWELEPAPQLNYRSLPRKARKLLRGEIYDRYDSRSEAEQAIVTVLVNAGTPFDEILGIFRHYPAAGKFHELERDNPTRATEWLRLSFNEARAWCITDSPARRLASAALASASAIAWRGRTGSADRAVYIAHAGLAYRSGQRTYHASTRDLAEIAGCGRVTASRASNRLSKLGLVELVAPAAHTFANRYRLPEKTKIDPLPHNGLKGVVQTSSFLLPDAFRQRGLGRPAYEVLTTFENGPQTTKEIAQKTGRHVQTVRKALTKMRKFGFVVKEGRVWHGRAMEDIDLEALAISVGTSGARRRQKEKHRADRLHRKILTAVLEGGDQ
jgi:predicted transcriptional regulator